MVSINKRFICFLGCTIKALLDCRKSLSIKLRYFVESIWCVFIVKPSWTKNYFSGKLDKGIIYRIHTRPTAVLDFWWKFDLVLFSAFLEHFQNRWTFVKQPTFHETRLTFHSESDVTSPRPTRGNADIYHWSSHNVPLMTSLRGGECGQGEVIDRDDSQWAWVLPHRGMRPRRPWQLTVGGNQR